MTVWRVHSFQYRGRAFVTFGPVGGEVCLSGDPDELAAALARLVAEVNQYRAAHADPVATTGAQP